MPNFTRAPYHNVPAHRNLLRVSAMLFLLAFLLIAFAVVPILAQAAGIATGNPTHLLTAQAVPTAQLTPDFLAGLFAIALSLGVAYIPGVNTRFNALDSQWKATIMGIGIVVLGAVAFDLSCGGFINLQGVTCDRAGIVGVVQVIIAALVANVGSYTLLVKPFQPKTDGSTPGQTSQVAQWGSPPPSLSGRG